VILGVTGSVGAGKSTIAALLKTRGFEVLDVDDVAARAAVELGLSPGEALRRVLGGDRALEQSLVQLVKREVAAWCAQTHGPKVIDAALLFEHGLDVSCDRTLCARGPIDERRRRVSLRSTTSATHFDRIEASQWPEEEKARRASLTVWTNRPLAEVESQVLAAGLE
jgi:dephospho-CoA kinase